ncbi:hypothetical protein N9B73_01110 [Verrucomicrobiales bacterium]|nr:hypothetical protein [Verrucomicrobiales bacterium]
MSGSVLIAAARPNPGVIEVLGGTLMVLRILIGFSCLISALFSFNHFFHERRGRQMKGGEALSALSWHGPLGLVLMLREALIALYSLLIYWRDNRSGRITFLVGISFFSGGIVCAWLMGAFETPSTSLGGEGELPGG